jgi:hypothetical protein
MFCMLNICVKAEPVALIPIKVKIHGNEYDIEKLAKVGLPNKFQYCLIPNNEAHIEPLTRDVLKEHPELKAEVKVMTKDGFFDADEVDDSDSRQKVVLLTVPPVDKERHDTMIELVDLFNDKCKKDMQIIKVKYDIKIGKALLNKSEETIDEVKGRVETLTGSYSDMRDKQINDKKEEIEEAYKLYMENHEEQEAKKREEQEARGERVGFSMNMFGSDDE